MGQFPFFEKPLQNSPRLCLSLLSLLALGFILLIRDLCNNPKAVDVGAHAAEWMWRSQDNLQEPAQHWVLGLKLGFSGLGEAVEPSCLSVNTLHSSSVRLLFFSLEIPYFREVQFSSAEVSWRTGRF